MNAPLAVYAAGDLGLTGLIILCAIFLLGCVVFAVALAYILKSFLRRGQRNDAPEGDGLIGRFDE